MMILWPYGEIEPSESELLDELHGDWTIQNYSVPTSQHPLGIAKVIKDNPDAFVYVANSSQAVVASMQQLRFGVVEYDTYGARGVYHHNPLVAPSMRLQVLWVRPDAGLEDLDLNGIGLVHDKAVLN